MERVLHPQERHPEPLHLLDAVEALYRDLSAKGVLFSIPPKKQDFGGVLAQFVDSEGTHCSVGAEGGVALRRL